MANEEFYIGQIFDGKYPPEAAIWCNANNAFIEKIADGKYEIKAIPAPTEDNKKATVRGIRNGYLADYDFTQLADAPFDNSDKARYAKYRQYLRDYTKAPSWWEHNPMTYEEWLVAPTTM